MDKIDTDELRRIVAEATPGPWQQGEMVSGWVFAWNLPPDHQDACICEASEVNAPLIAIAPDLAAEVLASRAREAELQARLDEARAAWEAFEGATITDDHHAAVDRMRAALGIGDTPHD